MLGTIVNSIAIIIGALLGNLLKQGIPERIKETIMQGIGLAVLLIGISMTLETNNVLIIILSLVIGGVVGEKLKIEEKLDTLGSWLERKAGQEKGDVAKGFVTASLVYCVGAMAIMGALESGLTGQHNTLYAKSALDGITSIIFASSMGLGVAFSSIPVFLYQGSITLGASLIKGFLNDAVVTEMTATGGLLILGIGINMLGLKKIKVGNLLPAIFAAILVTIVIDRLPI